MHETRGIRARTGSRASRILASARSVSAVHQGAPAGCYRTEPAVERRRPRVAATPLNQPTEAQESDSWSSPNAATRFAETAWPDVVRSGHDLGPFAARNRDCYRTGAATLAIRKSALRLCNRATRSARPIRLLSAPCLGPPASTLTVARGREQASTTPTTSLPSWNATSRRLAAQSRSHGTARLGGRRGRWFVDAEVWLSLMGSGVCSLCGERQAPVSGSRLRHGGSSRPRARSRSWCRCSAGRDIASCGNGFSHHLLLARLSDCCLLATPALPRRQLPPIAAPGTTQE
jgi:hypothetical protein